MAYGRDLAVMKRHVQGYSISAKRIAQRGRGVGRVESAGTMGLCREPHKVDMVDIVSHRFIGCSESRNSTKEPAKRVVKPV